MKSSRAAAATCRRAPAGAVLAALLSVFPACDVGTSDGPGVRDRPNLLLISIDTLRLDRLGCYGGPDENSPRVDALAADGVLFRQTQAPRGLTWPSLTTLMTGTHPRTHGVRVNGTMLGEEISTLPEVLQAAGYDTGGFIANMCDAPNRGLGTFFCAWWEKDGPPAERKPRAWATHDQPAWDAAITREADAFIRRPRDRPFFAWVHYLDPHKPYDVVEEFVRDEYDGSFSPEEELIDARTIQKRALTLPEREQMLAVYDSQITATDAHLGGLLDTLVEMGLAQDTLVVFTADHGEELGDHNFYFYHLSSVYQQVLSAPWVMRWPGRLPAGRAVEESVQMVDIVPTILDLLDLGAPETVEGTSRTGLVDGRDGARGADIVFSEWQDQMVIVGEGPWRFIWNPNNVMPKGRPFGLYPDAGFVIASEELYNLEDDPLQTRNIASDHAERVREMRARACAFVRERPFHQQVESAIPEDVRDRLQALGYIQDTSVPDEGQRLINHCRESP